MTKQDLNQKIILNILALYLIDNPPWKFLYQLLCSIALNYIQRKGPKPPLTLLKPIHQLKKRDDKVITKPDKGSGVVVMDKEEYLCLLSETSIIDTTKFRHFLSTSNFLFTNSNVTCAILVMLVTHLATYTRKRSKISKITYTANRFLLLKSAKLAVPAVKCLNR